MKKFVLFLLVIGAVINCSPQKNTADPKQETAMKPEKNDDGEWDIEVFDTQYDYFLSAHAKPMSFYNEATLKSRNTFLVSEWNSLYMSGRYRNIIESSIDYDPQEKYGLKFEYKLYQVFAYVSWKYGLRLNGLSATDSYR